MKSFLFNRNHQLASLRPVFSAIATLAAALTASNCAEAASRRAEQSVTSVDSRSPGEPIMAIVSLRSQRVTIYDAKGWILQAPVSSGQKGRETPAGIFSVIEKDEDHHSNLYDDAWMPHMQRITWSGVAMHGGPLPGYAASHGCIRLPYDFARRIFNLTPMGMRVIVAPSDVAPVEITHAALAQFAQKPDAAASAAALAAEAKEAAKKAEQARLAAVGVSREVARATIPVRTAENLKARADAQLAAAERALARERDPDDREEAERAKAKAAAKIAELEPQLEAAKAELQRKLDAAAPLREAAAAAESARVAAAEAARQAAGNLEPVSVFISRKTQRLYVRQAFKPIFDAPVTIQDPDRPIGTHVFTAAERTGNEAAVRWNVVSVDGGHSNELAEARGRASEGRARDVEPVSVDPGAAKEALDRVAIPQDVLDRLGGMALARSSLIISDEGLSSETGKGTEFVVLLNGQPQGGIKFRRHASLREPRYERPRARVPYSRSPFGFPFSTW